jgi:hypothetical protein
VQGAAFFVGAESGMWNASYVLGKPSAVLYGGGDYGGFMHDDRSIRYVMAGARDCFCCRWRCGRLGEGGVAPCIDEIATEQVVGAVRSILAQEGLGATGAGTGTGTCTGTGAGIGTGTGTGAGRRATTRNGRRRGAAHES